MREEQIDNAWTLFLDRDGVINKRLVNNYVKTWEEFEFLPGALKAIKIASEYFQTIVVVTNQQGIGKGLMTAQDLELIHSRMTDSIAAAGGRIDHVFYCAELDGKNPDCRKPNTGMAAMAKQMFPVIEFSKSLMVGDSPSDMQFGERMGMDTAFIGEDERYECFDSLIHAIETITSPRLR